MIGNSCFAYYYVDDICVSTDSAYSNNYTWTGIEENANQLYISVYPNPATDYLNIDITTNNLKSTHLIIYDNMGRKVLEKKTTESKTELNIKGLESRLYFLQVQSEGSASSPRGKEIISKKFVKE